jgi:chorismate mutase
MSASDLAALRAKVEEVDARIIAAMAERLETSREIGRVKAALDQAITDPAREALVVQRATTLARRVNLPEDEIRFLYWRIVAMSRRAQLDG